MNSTNSRTPNGTGPPSDPPRIPPWDAFVPGRAQFLAGRPELGLLLIATYVSAILGCLLTWGTILSFALLSTAFLTHSASFADAIVSNAFPGFRRGVVVASVSIVLVLTLYLPAAAMAFRRGYPAWESRPLMGGFLVDLDAYQSGDPARGHHVWLQTTGWRRPRLARVLATSGEEVQIRTGEIFVGGKPVPGVSLRNRRFGDSFELSVPKDHLLVGYQSGDDPELSLPANWELIPQSEVVGRAWARSYPIWNRRLLN